MPEALFDLADSEGISCRFVFMPKPFLGLYDNRSGDYPLILLHENLKKNHYLLRCILAEELGHHFTSSGDLLAFARTDKACVAFKQERQATWWAVQYLVPIRTLANAINSGLFLTWELAEYFKVTERFMGTSLCFYLERKGDELVKLLQRLPYEIMC